MRPNLSYEALVEVLAIVGLAAGLGGCDKAKLAPATDELVAPTASASHELKPPVVTTIQAPVGAVPITLSPNNKAAGEKSCNGEKNAAKVH